MADSSAREGLRKATIAKLELLPEFDVNESVYLGFVSDKNSSVIYNIHYKNGIIKKVPIIRRPSSVLDESDIEEISPKAIPFDKMSYASDYGDEHPEYFSDALIEGSRAVEGALRKAVANGLRELQDAEYKESIYLGTMNGSEDSWVYYFTSGRDTVHKSVQRYSTGKVEHIDPEQIPFDKMFYRVGGMFSDENDYDSLLHVGREVLAALEKMRVSA